MKKKVSVQIVEDGLDAFFKRVHDNARKLDAGEAIPNETVIYFESAADMLRMMTTQKMRLMGSLRETGPLPITLLAARLGRNKRAVSRDIAAMRENGLVKTRYVTNAGHGRNLVVMRAASKVELKSTI